MYRIRRILATAAIAVTTIGLALLGSPGAAHAAGGGNVSIWWDFNGGPSTATSITFPLTVGTDTAHQEGTYFAQQFAFTGGGAVGYTGLQPMATRTDGTTPMRALFSSFNDASTSSDPNCSDGADGGGGTTCRVIFNATYGHTFNLVVSRVATDTWDGKVVDTTTGASTHIGRWNIPGSGALHTSQGGFVEYYASVPSCAELPRVNVTFGAPFTDAGATGRAGTNGEYSDCVGQTTYKATPVGAGINIVRGNVQPFTLHAASGRCLDNLNGSNTTPALWDCNGGTNQAWHTTAGGELKTAGACLDARGEATTPGTPVDLYPCHGGANQQWSIAANGTIVGASGLCLNAVGTGNGARVELNTCDGRSSSHWTRVV